MSKGKAMLIALALMAVPAGARGQEIGASFLVRARSGQPAVAVADGATSARVPRGWAYSISEGTAAETLSPRLVSGVEPVDARDVQLPRADRGTAPAETITLLFVPL